MCSSDLGVLVVGKKKKDILVKELRERKYEAFPPKNARNSKSDEEELGNDSDKEEEDEEENDTGARDYGYLLSMAIWSFTAERLEKLREAIEKKKAEHDELLAKSEKDLWCEDLDEFMVEWDKQMAIDAEIQTKIRRMGRRASKKIGAGKSRKAKDDDEYEPEKKSRAKPKAAPKAASTAAPKGKLAQSTSAQRFADMFGSKSKVKKEGSDAMDLSDNFSDDDFMSLSGKPAATQSSRAPSVSASQSMSQAPSQIGRASCRERV